MYQTTYALEDIARIDVVFRDGDTEAVTLKDGEDGEMLQDRIDAFYTDCMDMVEALMAYDVDGKFIASRTPDDFFVLREGF